MSSPSQCEVDGFIRHQAAEWLVRRDRGLSAQESIEFQLWLAADERHAVAIERSRTAWAMLDRIPEEFGHESTVRAAKRRWMRNAIMWTGLAAAAAFAIIIAPLSHRPAPQPASSGASAAPVWVSPQIVTLSDGTLVRLNAGSEVRESFTADERRIQLVRGEAHFSVAKNPQRPFVVQAGTIEARAVGTAFNVNLQSAAVEILVTEGTVAVSGQTSAAEPIVVRRLEPAAAASAEASVAVPTAPPGSVSDLLLTAGQRAVVALAPISARATVVVTDLSKDELTRALAWQEPLLRLSGATLADLAAEFQRRTGYRLILADPQLAVLRTGGRFRGDDVEGFVRLLEDNYGIHSETTPDGAIVLRQGPTLRRD